MMEGKKEKKEGRREEGREGRREKGREGSDSKLDSHSERLK